MQEINNKHIKEKDEQFNDDEQKHPRIAKWRKLYFQFNKYAGSTEVSGEALDALSDVNIGIGDIINEIHKSISSQDVGSLLYLTIEDAYFALGVADEKVDAFIVYAVEIASDFFGEMSKRRINEVVKSVKSST